VPLGDASHPQTAATNTGVVNQNHPLNANWGVALEEPVDDAEGEDYVADTEDDDAVNYNNDRDHRRLRNNRHGMRRHRPKVRDRDDSIGIIKFVMPSIDGKYDPDVYLEWELLVDQKFECHDFPNEKRVRSATSEFSNFASVW
jgi:hypothetical protein